MADRLDAIRRSYMARYGLDGWYQRLNGRTVSQILTECQPVDVNVIASGEVDGLRYELSGPPEGRLSCED